MALLWAAHALSNGSIPPHTDFDLEDLLPRGRVVPDDNCVQLAVEPGIHGRPRREKSARGREVVDMGNDVAAAQDDWRRRRQRDAIAA